MNDENAFKASSDPTKRKVGSLLVIITEARWWGAWQLFKASLCLPFRPTARIYFELTPLSAAGENPSPAPNPPSPKLDQQPPPASQELPGA